MAQTVKQIATKHAILESRKTFARVSGMKLRAQSEPPSAAVGGFPYPGRSCAEWEELPNGQIVERQMTLAQRKRDAKQGSAKLLHALLEMAA